MKTFLKTVLLGATLTSGVAMAQPLEFTTYNPGEKAIFPVSSTLVTGEKDAILFDAQFGVQEGRDLVKLIKDSGKNLKLIYVSGGDPDFYFGLQPLVKAFPNVKIVASQGVVDHINHTKAKKISYWGPILGENAPTQIIVPEVFNGETLTLEDETIEVKEINTHQAYLWDAKTKTAFGGVLVTSGQHVWMADAQTEGARAEWIAALTRLIDMKPNTVIPGHYLGERPQADGAARFNRAYLEQYQQAVKDAEGSDALMAIMQKKYPQLPLDEGFKISAKVSEGEMQW